MYRYDCSLFSLDYLVFFFLISSLISERLFDGNRNEGSDVIFLKEKEKDRFASI